MLTDKDFNLTKKSYFSFMITPPDGRRTYTFRLSKVALIIVVSLGVIGGVALGISTIYTSQTVSKLVDYKNLQSQTNDYQQQLKQYDDEIEELRHSIHGLLEAEDEINQIVNPKKTRRSRRNKKKSSKPLSSRFTKEYTRVKADSGTHEELLSNRLYFMQRITDGVTERLEKTQLKMKLFKSRFAATPSIWPVFGRIRSNFGYRTHPFTGKRQFHKGIDIPAWLGAPVKAAADGVVFYKGWYRGYGLLIALDHGHGYTSVYAHCSKLTANRGQLVKKGETIANVGSSGISTGPHLHFEIRRWGKAVSPKQFLNLDLFTASKRLW